MRRDTPIVVATVLLAILLSFVTGSTASHSLPKSVGTAPIVSRTLVCSAVNGQPNHTTSAATIADLGSALSKTASHSGTVTATVLLGRKSTTSTLHLQPTAYVDSRQGQSESVAFHINGPIAATVAAENVIETSAGRYRALAGGFCPSPATDWWFAGGNGKTGFTDRLILSNAGLTDADVTVALWTPNGQSTAPRLDDIRVPAQSRVTVGIFAVAPDIPTVALHVHAKSGAVVAAVTDRRTSGLESDGGDLVPPTLPPSRQLVISGFPAGSGTRGLVVSNPGAQDATVSLKVATPSGEFTPSSVQQFVVGAGRTQDVDVTNALNGYAGAVILSSDQPVIGAGESITIPGGRNLRPDLEWLAATRPITAPVAVAKGREPDGGSCYLVLSAPEGAGEVRLTTTTGASHTIAIAAGHTLTVDITSWVKWPSGPWPFALTSIGTGPVYGVRELEFAGAHGALITAEPLLSLPQPIPLPPVRSDPRIAIH